MGLIYLTSTIIAPTINTEHINPAIYSGITTPKIIFINIDAKITATHSNIFMIFPIPIIYRHTS